MNYLLDTHILIWAMQGNKKLTQKGYEIILNSQNLLYFSSTSIWEVAIKRRTRPQEFDIEPLLFYQNLLRSDYKALDITSVYALATFDLPSIHKHPFDRIIIAQAKVENFVLLTADEKILAYEGNIIAV